MAGWSYRGVPRGLLRWVAAGGAVLACAATLSASGPLPAARPAPPAPAPRSTALRVLQMNLCDSGVAGCYTGRSVAEAAAVIRAERPDAVTVNEVCSGDVVALRQALTDVVAPRSGPVVSAFQPAWDARTGSAYRCRNGQSYGIGLVARLAPAPGGYASTGGTYPMQDPTTPEERAWLCVSPAEPTPPGARAGAVAVCTTHLTNGSATVARAQCGYLLGAAIPAVRARGDAIPLVLGGDLNLRSGADPEVGSCVPTGDRRVDDGIVQHVVATPEFVVGDRRTIAMHATDHPALLVTLTLQGAAAPAGAADRTLAATG